jgi:hypothetical protein
MAYLGDVLLSMGQLHVLVLAVMLALLGSGATARAQSEPADEWVRIEAPGSGTILEIAVATTNAFPVFGSWVPDEESLDDHARSIGLMMSVDGGESWQTAGAGPALDGAPYRHIRNLAISPTLAQDGTLFALAWGPREFEDEGGYRRRLVRAALFRSTDRGHRGGQSGSLSGIHSRPAAASPHASSWRWRCRRPSHRMGLACSPSIQSQGHRRQLAARSTAWVTAISR